MREGQNHALPRKSFPWFLIKHNMQIYTAYYWVKPKLQSKLNKGKIYKVNMEIFPNTPPKLEHGDCKCPTYAKDKEIVVSPRPL